MEVVGLREGYDDELTNYRQTRSLLEQHPDLDAVYNIGGGPANTISLLESIAMIESITGKPSEVQFEAERKGDLRYFVSDIERARSTFGFNPTVQPKEGLTRLID